MRKQVVPYNNDSTASRLLSEVKHYLAQLVLRWGTTLESWEYYFLFLHFVTHLSLVCPAEYKVYLIAVRQWRRRRKNEAVLYQYKQSYRYKNWYQTDRLPDIWTSEGQTNWWTDMLTINQLSPISLVARLTSRMSDLVLIFIIRDPT